METASRNGDWKRLADIEPEAAALIKEALSHPREGAEELTGLLNSFYDLYSEAVEACRLELESIHSQLKDSEKRQEAFEAWQGRNE